MNIWGKQLKGEPHWGKPVKPQVKPAERDIRFKGFAQTLYRNMPPPVNYRVGNISIEDATARTMVIPSVYIPQQIAAIKLRQNPYETGARNFFAWLGIIGVTLLAKHPTFGFNAIFNQFIVPKVQDPKTLNSKLSHLKEEAEWQKIQSSPLLKWINSKRPELNYLKIMNDAKINLKTLKYKAATDEASLLKAVRKGTYWADLDVNEKRLMLHFIKNELKNKPQSEAFGLLKRISAFKMLALLFTAMMVAYVIGIWLQKIVFKYVSPLDRKFVPQSRVTNDFGTMLSGNGSGGGFPSTNISALRGRYQ